VRGLGVGDDVGLGRRRPIAACHGSAHENDLGDPLGDARLLPHRHRDVRQGRRRHERDASGRLLQHRLDDQVDAVAGVERADRQR